MPQREFAVRSGLQAPSIKATSTEGVRILPSTGAPSASPTLADKSYVDNTASTLQANINTKANSATTLAGYGITNAYTKAQIDAGYAPLSHTQAWSTITSRPTTLAGYGIADALTSAQIAASYAAKGTTLASYGITDAISASQLELVEDDIAALDVRVYQAETEIDGIITAATTLAGRVTTAESDIATKLDATEKGAANGVATLGADSKIVSSQLPALAISNTSVVANEAAMLALTAEVGDVAVRSDISKSFILTAADPSVLSNWQELLSPPDVVLSVFGRTGAVVAASGDYTAGQITVTPAGTLASVTAQAALEELDGEMTALQTALDAAESDIDALEAADTALDGRVDALEAAPAEWVDTATSDLNMDGHKIVDTAGDLKIGIESPAPGTHPRQFIGGLRVTNYQTDIGLDAAGPTDTYRSLSIGGNGIVLNCGDGQFAVSASGEIYLASNISVTLNASVVTLGGSSLFTFSELEPAFHCYTPINLNGFGKIIGVVDPTDAQDAATKNYVDDAIEAIPAPAWGDITSKPTTLAGYSITDAASDSELADVADDLATEVTARIAADAALDGRLDALEASKTVAVTASGATTTVDVAGKEIVDVEVEANTTIEVDNAADGQKLLWRFKQDATGRTVTLGTDFAFGADFTEFTASAATKVDYVGTIYNAAAAKHHVVSISKGF